VKNVEHDKKYHSYLLRLWIEDTNGKRGWRISLENPFTGERRGFASLNDLCTYLKEQMIINKGDQEV